MKQTKKTARKPPKKRAATKRSKRAPKAPAGKPIFIVERMSDVAAFFEVSVHTVADWFRNGAPGESRNYNLRELSKWRSARLKPKVPDDPDLEWKRYRADLAGIRLQRERGALIDINIHDSAIMRICAIFRTGLLAAVPTLAAQVAGLGDIERRELIEHNFHRILEAVASNVRSDLSPKQKKRRGAARDV